MIIEVISEIFTTEYLLHALIAGLLISVCTALLGVELVLKKFSMLGDGLSHVSFGTLAVASVFNVARLEVSLIVVIFVAFLLLQIKQNSKINGDAAIAIVSGSFMALGLFATNYVGGANVDFNSYMFGSIFAINKDNFVLTIVMCLLVIAVYCLFYNKIFSVTFDEGFCKATGGKASIYNLIIAALTAVTIVIGMKLIGTLLIASLTVFPVVSAYRLSKKYRSCVITSAIISVTAYIIGFTISNFYAKMPISAGVIFSNLFIMLLCYVISKVKNGVSALRFKGE